MAEKEMIAVYEAARPIVASLPTYDERFQVVMNLLKYVIGSEVFKRKAIDDPGLIEQWVDLCEEAANTVMELPDRFVDARLHPPCGKCAACKARETTTAN